MFPLLSDYGPEMAGHHLQLYGWLQHGSSLVGLAVVVLALALWLGNAPAPAKPPVRRIAPLERLVWSRPTCCPRCWSSPGVLAPVGRRPLAAARWLGARRNRGRHHALCDRVVAAGQRPDPGSPGRVTWHERVRIEAAV